MTVDVFSGTGCMRCLKPFGIDGYWTLGSGEVVCDDCAEADADPVVKNIIQDFRKERAERRRRAASDQK